MRISDWSSDVCSSDLLRKDATYVKVNGKSISDVVLMPLDIDLAFFQQLELTENEEKIDKRLLTEIGIDRKSVVSGKSVTVSVDLGGGRNIKKQNNCSKQLALTVYKNKYVIIKP